MQRTYKSLLLIGILGFYFSSSLLHAQNFSSPFDGEYRLGNWHDHNSPREFVDTNGFTVNSEGDVFKDFIDGHEGYDWLMPEGTPLYAVADGEITFSGEVDPFFCPILDKTTTGNLVVLAVAIGSETYYVNYAHLATLMVSKNQKVKKGDLLGYSGNTGCSTTPHLHFAVYKYNALNKFSCVDPYGWNGQDVDPWTLDPDGAESINLWDANSTPARFFQSSFAANDCSGCRSSVAITKVRWMGPNDSSNPNNEFVELTIDPRFGPKKVDFQGWTLKNNAGKSFKLKPKAVSNSKAALTVYSGKGKSTKKQIFLNQSKEIWNNSGDCIRLYNSKKVLIYYFIVGSGTSCKK